MYLSETSISSPLSKTRPLCAKGKAAEIKNVTKEKRRSRKKKKRMSVKDKDLSKTVTNLVVFLLGVRETNRS